MTGHVSDDVAGSEGGAANPEWISQSPICNTHAGKLPLKRPPHATADPRQWPADIPAFPGCSLIGH